MVPYNSLKFVSAEPAIIFIGNLNLPLLNYVNVIAYLDVILLSL